MNLFNPDQIMASYLASGEKKVISPVWRLLLLGILAGMLTGFGSAVTNTATHAIDNVSVARIIYGLLFPFGLGMAILLGGELFTGNCMLPICVLEGKASVWGMLKNWLWVYTGNFLGAGLLAAGCAFFGQLEFSNGGLALHTLKVATTKCSLPFANGVVLGLFCNILVCIGVLCAISAKDTTGKILASYLPIAFFVICGFENSVANMYYIPAGLFAKSIPKYAELAAQNGLNTDMLTWSNYLLRNLLPVSLGNLLGGLAVGLLMWLCYLRWKPDTSKAG